MGLFGKKVKDEYKDIFDKYEKSGFVFNYNKRIGRSKPIFEDEINGIDFSKRNDTEIPLFVNCKKCNSFMDYQPGESGIFDSWWKCPICGTKVRESTVFNQIDRENEEFLNDIFSDDDEIPEGCEACGGPWPDCMSSCNMYDD